MKQRFPASSSFFSAAATPLPFHSHSANCRPLPLPLLLLLACGIGSARADTFSYDAAGRLTSAAQTSGLFHTYSYDEEGNILSAVHSGTDTTNSGGAGNGIPDWWENFYFGVRGIDPLAIPASDGLSNLLKYTLGLNPLTPAAGTPYSLTFQTYLDGKVYPYLTYVRFKEAAGLLQLEQSNNLTTWQSGSLYLTPASAAQDFGNGTELLVFRSLTPVPNAFRLFFRLKAFGN